MDCVVTECMPRPRCRARCNSRAYPAVQLGSNPVDSSHRLFISALLNMPWTIKLVPRSALDTGESKEVPSSFAGGASIRRSIFGRACTFALGGEK